MTIRFDGRSRHLGLALSGGGFRAAAFLSKLRVEELAIPDRHAQSLLDHRIGTCPSEPGTAS